MKGIDQVQPAFVDATCYKLERQLFFWTDTSHEVSEQSDHLFPQQFYSVPFGASDTHAGQ